MSHLCSGGMSTTDRPSVSVVVTTRNEAADLERCLASIRGQTLPDVEIVVVDNGSTDGTREIAAALADIVLDQGPERSAQRNAGARAARAEYILFADADMELTPTVLEECLSVSRPRVAAVIVPELQRRRRACGRPRRRSNGVATSATRRSKRHASFRESPSSGTAGTTAH